MKSVAELTTTCLVAPLLTTFVNCQLHFLVAVARLPIEIPPAEGIDLWEFLNRYAALTSLIGLPLTLTGLWLAFKEAQKAQRVSEAAQGAVLAFRRDLNMMNTVTSFAETLSALQETKRLVRYRTWVPLPDRLSEVRRLIIAIREQMTGLDDEKRTILQSAISALASIEKKIELFLADEAAHVEGAILPGAEAAAAPVTLDGPAINEMISTQIDALQRLMSELRNQIGVN